MFGTLGSFAKAAGGLSKQYADALSEAVAPRDGDYGDSDGNAIEYDDDDDDDDGDGCGGYDDGYDNNNSNSNSYSNGNNNDNEYNDNNQSQHEHERRHEHGQKEITRLRRELKSLETQTSLTGASYKDLLRQNENSLTATLLENSKLKMQIANIGDQGGSAGGGGGGGGSGEEIESLKNDNNVLESTLIDVQNVKRLLKSELDDANVQIKTLETAFQLESEKSVTRNAETRKVKLELQTALHSITKTTASTKTLMLEKEKEMNTISKNLQTESTKLTDARNDADTLSRTIERLNLTINDNEQYSIKANSQINELHTKLAALAALASTTEDTEKRLNTRIEEMQVVKTKTIDDLTKENNTQRVEINDQNLQLSELKLQLEMSKIHDDSDFTRRTDARTNASVEEESLRVLNKMLDKENNELKAKLVYVKDKFERGEEKLEVSSNRVSELEDNIKDFENRVINNSGIEERESLERKCLEYEDKIKEFENSKERDELTTQLNLSDMSITTLQTELSTLKSKHESKHESAELAAELSELAVTELNLQVTKLTNDMNTISITTEQKDKQKDDKINSNLSQIKDQATTITTLTNENQTLNQTLNLQITTSQSDRTNTDTQFTSLTNQITMLNTYLDKKTANIKTLELSISNSTFDSSALNGKIGKLQVLLDESKDLSSSELATLEATLEIRHDRLLKESTNKTSSALTSLSERLVEIEQLKTIIVNMKGAVTNATSDGEGLRVYVEELEGKCEALTREIESVKISYDERSSDFLTGISEELHTTKKQLRETQTELSSLTNTKQELDLTQLDLTLANKGYANLQSAIENLQVERDCEVKLLEDSITDAVMVEKDKCSTRIGAMKEVNLRDIGDVKLECENVVNNANAERDKYKLQYDQILKDNINVSKSLDEAIKRLQVSQEDIIDRLTIKNIILDWHVKRGEAKKQVMTLLSSILHFTDDEKDRAGLRESDVVGDVGRRLLPPLPPSVVEVGKLEGEGVRDKWVNFLLAESNEDEVEGGEVEGV